MKIKANIYLTGFMGAGKTEVGQKLAARLDKAFADTDTLLENLLGVSIAVFFQDHGEEKFRDAETGVVDEITQKTNMVVALGGGTLLRQISRLKVLSSGFVVYLKAEPETLNSRLGHSAVERPLLRGLEGEGRLDAIKRLLLQRQGLYELAHLVIDTDHRNPDQVVDDILKKLGARGQS